MIGEPTFSAWRDSPDFGARTPQPATRLRCGRALRAVERDLASYDPGLLQLFQFFTRLIEDEEMPGTEQVSTWPAWLFPRLGRRLAKLGQPMARLSRRAARLGRPVAKLGRQLAKLGRRLAKRRTAVSQDG